MSTSRLNPEAEEWWPTPQPQPLPLCCYMYSTFLCPPQVCTIIWPATVASAAVAPPNCDDRLRRSQSPPHPPAPPKLEWRPKNSATATSSTGGDTDSSPAPKTTLMIKNIPNQLRRDSMLKFLDNFCKLDHSLAYDFFYLPFDFRKGGNLGYAFVNMTTGEGAMKMEKLLSNYKWRGKFIAYGNKTFSRKVCEIQFATIQGKQALVKRFRKSRLNCDDVEFLPVLLDPPRDGSDPNPPPPINIGKLIYCRGH